MTEFKTQRESGRIWGQTENINHLFLKLRPKEYEAQEHRWNTNNAMIGSVVTVYDQGFEKAFSAH